MKRGGGRGLAAAPRKASDAGLAKGGWVAGADENHVGASSGPVEFGAGGWIGEEGASEQLNGLIKVP